MQQSKFFRYGVGLLLFLLIAFMLTKVEFILQPIGIMITTVLAPILIAGVLYYLLNPVVRVITKGKVPKTLAVLIVFLVFIALMSNVIAFLYPILKEQLISLGNYLPTLARDLMRGIQDLQNSPWTSRFAGELANMDIEQRLSDTLGQIGTTVASSTVKFIDVISSTVIVLVTVPFVLFYMLKEGDKLPKRIVKFAPKKYKQDTREVLSKMNAGLSAFIQGQIIVSLFVGICIYIWYLIIGLDYALVLALVALFTNLIPFIGPFIGTIPGVIMGFIQDPYLALYVIIGVVVIQQIESNLISPQVMGKKLDVHPVTVILLLLIAGSLAGFVGLLLALPTYTILKVIVSHIYYRVTDEEDRKA
ncbi:AI-2E family transporter [Bacillus sp. CGMCC 1.16541]|uniref:AI-2E family transporter n=1 Tax=Bacillus sp. CGMCC 1.16541 TaxID=2185143 RepID=UPI000D7298E9|nr:AI-2E family transporter [Bacillus sp. CGMCC 1.16541]